MLNIQRTFQKVLFKLSKECLLNYFLVSFGKCLVIYKINIITGDSLGYSFVEFNELQHLRLAYRRSHLVVIEVIFFDNLLLLLLLLLLG